MLLSIGLVEGCTIGGVEGLALGLSLGLVEGCTLGDVEGFVLRLSLVALAARLYTFQPLHLVIV